MTDNLPVTIDPLSATVATGKYLLGDSTKEIARDGVNILVGHWLKAKSWETWETVMYKARKRLEDKGILAPQTPPTAIIEEIVVAVSREDRDELQDIWADLIAAAMDPKRASKVRGSFIWTLKQLDPPDALVFKTMFNVRNFSNGSEQVAQIEPMTSLSKTEISLSLSHLQDLKCVAGWGGLRAAGYAKLTEYGAELLRLLT